MSDDTFRPEPRFGPDPRIGRKQSVQPSRNISLTPEIIAMGITDIAVRGKGFTVLKVIRTGADRSTTYQIEGVQ